MDGRQCSVYGAIRRVFSIMLLKSGETVNTDRYWQPWMDLNQALSEIRPEYQKTQHKVILPHDYAPSHTAKPVKKTIGAIIFQILSNAAYSPYLAPSDYYLFASMHRWDTHLLRSASLLTKMYKNCSMIGLPKKSNSFFGVASTNCKKDGKNV